MKYVLDIPAIIYRDISGIGNYIAADKPTAAKKIVGELFKAIERLADNPFAYIELNKKFDVETDLRGCFKKPYVILFRIEENIIKVYRVIDGRSDYLVRIGLKESSDDI